MAAEWREFLEPSGPGRMRITRHGRMLADAMLVADEQHMEEHSDDRSPSQLVNTACLPGIVGDAWAMADWHFGYGFPIGGVVATDVDAGEQGGAISPGGVGFDINCGVRLCATELTLDDVDSKALATSLSRSVPAGVSRKGGVGLSASEIDTVLSDGAGAAVDLGSGNHFLELQVVDRVVDEHAASAFGLRQGQVTAMIHTGSRGLGHQVCTEHVAAIEGRYRRDGDSWHSAEWGITLADRQLAAAPIHSREGSAYLDAMRAAGNYAFANRSALTQRLREVLREQHGRDGGLDLVYDVSHNIAKVEQHHVHGSSCTCCVHRKGATRALGGDHPELADAFSGVGQPVLVPGDMGTASWVLAGPKSGGNDAFSSSCHGAGRRLSRAAARKSVDSGARVEALESRGIHIRAKTPNVLSEEAPEAYKDVDEVIRLTGDAGLARPVARLRPIAVIKG